jgi:hypothetical protein
MEYPYLIWSPRCTRLSSAHPSRVRDFGKPTPTRGVHTYRIGRKRCATGVWCIHRCDNFTAVKITDERRTGAGKVRFCRVRVIEIDGRYAAHTSVGLEETSVQRATTHNGPHVYIDNRHAAVGICPDIKIHTRGSSQDRRHERLNLCVRHGEHRERRHGGHQSRQVGECSPCESGLLPRFHARQVVHVQNRVSINPSRPVVRTRPVDVPCTSATFACCALSFVTLLTITIHDTVTTVKT